MHTVMNIQVVYATETGNSEYLAHLAVQRLRKAGLELPAPLNLDQFTLDLFDDVDVFLPIVSTWGDGDPPCDAEDFFDALSNSSPLELKSLRYAVLALGDSGYDYFCKFGKDLENELSRHGAHRMLDRIDCDVDYEDEFEQWIGAVTSRLGNRPMEWAASVA